jgi:hypothetical protein
MLNFLLIFKHSVNRVSISLYAPEISLPSFFILTLKNNDIFTAGLNRKLKCVLNRSKTKNNLEVCTVTAVMEDFDFPVNVNVTQFNVKVPGQPTIVVSGNKMDGRARAAIAKATRGDVVVISEIKASFVGIDQVAKRVSPCTYEIQ